MSYTEVIFLTFSSRDNGADPGKSGDLGFFHCFSYKHDFCCLSTSAVLTHTHNYGIKGCPKNPFQSLLNPEGVKFLLRWLIQTMKYLHRAQKKVCNSVRDVLNCSRMTLPASPLLENTVLRDNPHAKHILHPMERENLSLRTWNRVGKQLCGFYASGFYPLLVFRAFPASKKLHQHLEH